MCNVSTGASGNTGFSIFLMILWEMGLLLCQISRLMFNSDLEASQSFVKGELGETSLMNSLYLLSKSPYVFIATVKMGELRHQHRNLSTGAMRKSERLCLELLGGERIEKYQTLLTVATRHPQSIFFLIMPHSKVSS